MTPRVAPVVLWLCAAAGGAAAQPASDPDWPCVQRKVAALSPAAVWTGPPIPDGADWRGDAEVAALVERLAQRRLFLEDAEADVAAFAATKSGDAARNQLALLFAGLFETMDAERGAVIEGIERYARRQVAMADAIRARASELDAARRAPEANADALAAEQNDLTMQIRIFDERRGSLSYVCEVPRLIEARLFALGRAITSAMPGG